MNLKLSDPAMLGVLTGPLVVGLSATTAVTHYGSSGTQSTPTVTANVSGGVAPYTYSWVQDGSGNAFTPSNASGASTYWSIAATFPNGYSANWKCTVTDSAGNSQTTGDVSVVVAP